MSIDDKINFLVDIFFLEPRGSVRTTLGWGRDVLCIYYGLFDPLNSSLRCFFILVFNLSYYIDFSFLRWCLDISVIPWIYVSFILLLLFHFIHWYAIYMIIVFGLLQRLLIDWLYFLILVPMDQLLQDCFWLGLLYYFIGSF